MKKQMSILVVALFSIMLTSPAFSEEPAAGSDTASQPATQGEKPMHKHHRGPKACMAVSEALRVNGITKQNMKVSMESILAGTAVASVKNPGKNVEVDPGVIAKCVAEKAKWKAKHEGSESGSSTSSSTQN